MDAVAQPQPIEIDRDAEKGEEALLDGGNLRGDLEDALAEFTFEGTFATANTFPQAPNPCLMVEGMGGIGLPLSERDAKAIITASAQAPFGHGAETVIDTNVRNTWEIDSNKISFQGPLWASFMEKTVVPYVWKALGIAPAMTPPRCELYKLLLYETGSHFLPHQDTAKSEGMFATIVVLLPSTFTGGQVRVQHSSEEKILDMSQDSTCQTSVLAWYIDVTHSVEPITSGYRLALSYNLVHTSPNIPAPSLPSTHSALIKLNRTLRKWGQCMYRSEDDQECNMLAYLLEHQYSEADLRKGVKALKGQDAHKLANIQPVLEKAGFAAYMANLEYNVVGYPEDNGYNSKRGRWGKWIDFDDDDDDSDDDDFGGGKQWSMLEETDNHLSIKNMFRLDGQVVGLTEFSIDSFCLVPSDSFEGVDPDEQEYEGYMGNGAGQLDYWYHRTVLVLVPNEKSHDFMFSAYGLAYALPTLSKVDPANPPPDMRRLAENAICRLQSSKEVGKMAQIALDWKDLSMWQNVCKRSGYSITFIGVARYVEALRLFSLEHLRPTLEQGLAKTTSLKERLDLLTSVFSNLSNEDEVSRAWCNDQKLGAVSRLVSITTADVPSLIEIVKGDVQKTMDIIIPQLQRLTCINDFWIAFTQGLSDASKEGDLPTAESKTEAEAPSAWTNAIKVSLDVAVNHWVRDYATRQVSRPMGGIYSNRYSAPSESDQRSQTSTAMLGLCLSVGLTSHCQPILDALVKLNEYTANKFRTLYVPLLPLLRQTLEQYQTSITTPPFSDFLRRLIGLYLRDLLGSRDPLIPQMPKIGCGCGDCAPLDGFLKSTQAEYQFKAGQGRRGHVSHQLSPVNHIVTYQTIHQGNPHTLSIRKRPEILEGYSWPKRQAKAKTFISSIGNESQIREIMGAVYEDVQKALSGARPFRWKDEQLSNPGVDDSMDTSTRSGPSNTGQPPPTVSTSGPTGTKRKKSALVSIGPVIDLTSD